MTTRYDVVTKWKCKECDEISNEDELLRATNPFTSVNDEIQGCPHCKYPGGFDRICEAEGCTALVSSGTPHEGDYFMTCYKHVPEQKCP